jgi:aminoglycoside phosphotransferase (APT) family kinase protein
MGTDRETRAFIETCLGEAFPGRRAHLLGVEPIPLGLNDLWRLRIDDRGVWRDIVLRRYRHSITWHADDDRLKAEREGRSIGHARAHELPVPQLFGHGADWTLVDAVDGHRLLDGAFKHDQRVRAVEALASVLAALHRLPLPDGPFPRVSIAAAIETLRRRAVASGDARLSASVARLRALPEDAPVFVHGDPNLSNVLFDDDFGVAGLIDWEDAAIGDYRFDIATALWFLRLRAPELAVPFIDAYELAVGRRVANLPQWMAFQTLRAWAVSAALRASGVTLTLFTTDEEKAAAEIRLHEAGF